MAIFFDIFFPVLTLIFYAIPAIIMLAESVYVSLLYTDSWEEDYCKEQKYKQKAVHKFTEEAILLDGSMIPLWKTPGLYTDLTLILVFAYMDYAFPVAAIIFYTVVNIGMRYADYYRYWDEIAAICRTRNKKYYAEHGWHES